MFTLVIFKYPAGKENVARVNGSDFINCTVPPTAQVLTSGNHRIVLGSTGKRWYISGVDHHCQMFQKLVIIVLPPEGTWSPISAPAPHGG
ncbi:Early nodulin-like protein 1, partial [Mucuna pruriens]